MMASVAQLIERRPHTLEVPGSNPARVSHEFFFSSFFYFFIVVMKNIKKSKNLKFAITTSLNCFIVFGGSH